jgi:hypothetical protein
LHIENERVIKQKEKENSQRLNTYPYRQKVLIDTTVHTYELDHSD